LNRLEGILAQDRALEEQIHRLQLEHQADRALWLENGSNGPEPRVSKELTEARFSHSQLQPDVAAAMQRLPAVQTEQRTGIEQLQLASREVDVAAYNRAVEVCRPAAARAAAQFRAGLSELAKLVSIAYALRRTAADDTAAFQAATKIDALGRTARAAGVPPAPQAGLQLLEALRVNPMASL
jgi:hypothetical protein